MLALASREYSCEDQIDDEVLHLNASLSNSESRLRLGRRSARSRRRQLVLGVSGAVLAAALAALIFGPLVAQRRSASGSSAAFASEAKSLLETKFSIDQQLRDQIISETRKAFDQELAKEEDARVLQLVKGIEDRVTSRLAKQIHARLPLELEPDQVGIMPRHFSETCARGSLAPEEHVLLFFHDDDQMDDIPNTAEEIAKGFQNDNAAFVGNEKLRTLGISGVRMCLEESRSPAGSCNTLCYSVTDRDWTYGGPGMPAGMESNWQKLLVALSGQIDSGLSRRGSHGNFVETLLNERHCKAPLSASATPTYCWMCPSKYNGATAGKMGQWSKDTGNWHIWGYGMTLDRTSTGDELRWQNKECNGNTGPWDTFYVVAQVGKAGAPPARVPPAPPSTPATTAAPPAAPARPRPPAASAPGKSVTLFCFSVMNVHNYELALIRNQLSQGASIFGCDDWSVFSDEKTWLSPGPPVRIDNTVLDIQVKAKAGTSTHFLNTDVFTTAWKMIRTEGKYKRRDWTVKVDPDAVFFPSRLRSHLRDLPHFPNGVYILNCLFNDGKYWFFGAVEVISREAVEAYFAGSEVCMRDLDRGQLGEDTWLRKCLDILHVNSTQDTGILSDGYCNEAPSPCLSGKATFHPFKNPDAYMQCFREAQADSH